MDFKKLTFDEWLTDTQAERDNISDVLLTPVVDIDKSILTSVACQEMRSQAEWFLSVHTAQSILASKAKYPDASAAERKELAKCDVRDMQYIVDSISAIYNGLYKRIQHQGDRR